jgi:hypothetical protein
MANYKKRSQSLMDEISENLKRTIKKYNEIDMDNDLSIIPSVENEELTFLKFNTKPQNETGRLEIRDLNSGDNSKNPNRFYNERNQNDRNFYSDKNAIINNTKKILDVQRSKENLNDELTSHNINLNNYFNNPSIHPENKYYNNTNTNISTQTHLNLKKNKILNDLDQFNNNLNKDFKEVEDLLESMIEKELKNI